MDRVWLISAPDELTSPTNGNQPKEPGDHILERLSTEKIKHLYSLGPGSEAIAARILASSAANRHNLPGFTAASDDIGPNTGARLFRSVRLIARRLRGGAAVVVASPELVRFVICHLLGIPSSCRHAVAQQPGALNLLLHDHGKWMLETMNDEPVKTASHLDLSATRSTSL